MVDGCHVSDIGPQHSLLEVVEADAESDLGDSDNDDLWVDR